MYYGSLTVPGIVPHGVWNPSMVNGIIFPSPAMNPLDSQKSPQLYCTSQMCMVCKKQSEVTTVEQIDQHASVECLVSTMAWWAETQYK